MKLIKTNTINVYKSHRTKGPYNLVIRSNNGSSWSGFLRNDKMYMGAFPSKQSAEINIQDDWGNFPYTIELVEIITDEIDIKQRWMGVFPKSLFKFHNEIKSWNER